jgi:WD40 repeat protein
MRGKMWPTALAGLAGVLVLLAGCARTAPADVRMAVPTPTVAATGTAAWPGAVASPTATSPRQATTAVTQSTRVAGAGTPPATATPAPTRGGPAAVLSGHTGPVTVLAWSPDGARFATSSGVPNPTDHTVRVWGADGTLLTLLEGHVRPVKALAWSPDGQILATGSADATVRLWDTAGTVLTTLSTAPDPVFSLAWSPDGGTLAVGAIPFQSLAAPRTPGRNPDLPGIIHLWRADGTLVTTLSTRYTGGKFLNLAWSPDGSLLAAGAIDYRLWRADGTPVAEFRGYATPAWGMAWSPDSQLLAVGDENGVVALYSVTGTTLATLTDHGSVDSLAFLPDGRTLAIGATLVSIENSRATPRALYSGLPSSLAWSPDGQRLAAGIGGQTVRLWRVDGTLLAILDGCGDMAEVVAWSPDGKMLAAGSKNQRVCLWKAGAGDR